MENLDVRKDIFYNLSNSRFRNTVLYLQFSNVIYSVGVLPSEVICDLVHLETYQYYYRFFFFRGLFMPPEHMEDVF